MTKSTPSAKKTTVQKLAAAQKPAAKKATRRKASFLFHPARLDALFAVLDAVAWMDAPDCAEVAQFAGIDPRTAGKLLKNATTLRLIDSLNQHSYTLSLPYPYKGSLEQKRAVVREALVRLPLLVSIRQFLRLGDTIQNATRKAATVTGIKSFDSKDFTTLLEWARDLGAIKPEIIVEDLLDEATQVKEQRHRDDAKKVIAFLSHSSKDKAFIRQLAGDLNSKGIGVWLADQRIKVGDSIPEIIAQGLAESDYFLIAISENSAQSAWVQKELNNALVHEIERRRVTIIPLKLDETTMPLILKDKKFADFSQSYRLGLAEVLTALEEYPND